jgi:polysaccharide biosynthesis transport protein
MLDQAPLLQLTSDAAPAGVGQRTASGMDFEGVLRWVRRNFSVVALCSLIGAGLGVTKMQFGTPTFTAAATLMIETRKARATRDDLPFVGDGNSLIEAMAQFDGLKSDLSLAALASSLPATLKEPISVQELQSGLSARNPPRTQLLEVHFTSPNPERSAIVANTVADAYIDSQRRSQRTVSTSATNWLNDQLPDLKAKLLAAEQEVQAFKIKHNLLSTEGKLVEDQQFAEANRQQIGVRSEIARLEGRNAKLQAVLQGKFKDVASSEFFADPVIAELRNRYIVLERGERELAKRVSNSHDSLTRLRSQKAELELQMRQELTRVARTLTSELEILTIREKALTGDFQRLAKSTTNTNEVQIQLRELERKNETYRTLYASTLQRHQTAVLQQTLDQANATVISVARAPTRPDGLSWPLMVALTGLLGGGLGGGLGFLRDMADKTYRTRQQIRSSVGSSAVWMVPGISRPGVWQLLDRPGRMLKALVTGRITSIDGLRHVVESPNSDFTLAMEAIKIELDRRLPHGRRVIGVVSALHEEGRMTVAKNLASLIALCGSRTLLIDGDIRGSGLTSRIASDAGPGLLELARDTSRFDEIVLTEPGSNLRFLPIGSQGAMLQTAAFLASSGMASVLSKAAMEFPYIVIDLPPITTSNDFHAIAPKLDAILLVIDWGTTPRSVIEDVLNDEPDLREKFLGVVACNADPNQLSRFQRTAPRNQRTTTHISRPKPIKADVQCLPSVLRHVPLVQNSDADQPRKLVAEDTPPTPKR